MPTPSGSNPGTGDHGAPDKPAESDVDTTAGEAAGLGALDEQPLGTRVPLPEERVVPIEDLLYRGNAAVDRAMEVRAEARRSGTGPAPAIVQEIWDLLELALTD